MMNVTCPKCGRVQYFVCGNKKCVCRKRVPKDKKPQKRRGDGCACPYCGFTESLDYWEEREVAAIKQAGLWPTQTQAGDVK